MSLAAQETIDTRPSPAETETFRALGPPSHDTIRTLTTWAEKVLVKRASDHASGNTNSEADRPDKNKKRDPLAEEIARRRQIYHEDVQRPPREREEVTFINNAEEELSPIYF